MSSGNRTSDPKTIDIPFENPPFMRVVLRILESHEVNGVTVIDKAEIENIYIPASNDPEYHTSPTSMITEDNG